MKQEIEERFTENLERVTHLVDVYQSAVPGPGRQPVGTADVLRAAVVFLHATLEDLLRSVLMWKLPVARAEHLRDVPLEGKKPRSTFTLDELTPYRGNTVDDLIARSVLASLEQSNFNNPAEVDRVLEKVGLARALLDPYRNKLGPMMARRHWIVHRADRNTASGRGHHAARPLQQAAVAGWQRAVEQFGRDVLAGL